MGARVQEAELNSFKKIIFFLAIFAHTYNIVWLPSLFPFPGYALSNLAAQGRVANPCLSVVLGDNCVCPGLFVRNCPLEPDGLTSGYTSEKQCVAPSQNPPEKGHL